MKKFIFFGRLVHEKGIEIILDAFAELYKNGVTSRHLDIYGVGVYEKACEALATVLPDHVTFHGWCEGEKRNEIFAQQDFCLMPSLIIESFGLTALESLKAGVPVIGFKKGGVEPFVSHELNIQEQPGDTHQQKLLHILAEIISSDKDKSTYLPDINLSDYSTDTWCAHFQQIAGNTKRILLVSDFTKRVGGIENYIHDVQDLLREKGYTVEMCGTHKKNSFTGLFKTALNISARRKLRRKIKEYKPELVWCHSVVRELGWLPLTTIPHNTKVLMMFHDMGYFIPRASKLYEVHHIPHTIGLMRRIRLGNSLNPIQWLLLIFKWLSLRIVRYILRHHQTTYLVPSGFMKPFSENLWASKNQKTVVLPHFVK